MTLETATRTNWLVVGLGNPGADYERTRHNVGFMLIDQLARESQTHIRRDECRSLVGRAIFGSETVELVKPQTYMNLSGEAVSCLVKKEGRAIEKLIVISDDLALPLGKIRIRPKGSHGGQNGLRSIIDCLKTQDFIRLRIGIGPDHPVSNASDFVLQSLGKKDDELLESVLVTAADAVKSIVLDGVDRAMGRFNADPPAEKEI